MPDNALLQKWYILDRCLVNGTMGGTGYLEVLASNAEDAVAKAAAGYPWVAGSEIGAALSPDVFKVERWVKIDG